MKIKVIDGRDVANPEDVAMLQALYSRSALSVDDQLAKVDKTGSARFMDNYVVGYGHKSIADCGTTTVFIEGVSTLAAKAIQDWPLYSGQETSTRYIDMSRQPIVDPAGSAASVAILNRWMEFYVGAQGKVTSAIRERHPRLEGQEENVYERAVKARTFDILRAFLPAGITTQLSWHTNLRQASDHLVLLMDHPSMEVRQVADWVRRALEVKYPASGFGESQASVAGIGKDSSGQDARRAWEKMVAEHATYPAAFDEVYKEVVSGRPVFQYVYNRDRARPFEEVMKSRPRGAILPHFMSNFCYVSYNFLLDFGSFRDIQRHRNGVCRMPMLTSSHGFEPWYLEELGRLDESLLGRAKALIAEQKLATEALHIDYVSEQYYVPLGARVPVRVTYGLPAAVYVMELRSGKMVHPTLRRAMHKMAKEFQVALGDKVALHVDLDSSDWDVRRGTQTITVKAAP
jgi:thymidylate synthase ThyX